MARAKKEAILTPEERLQAALVPDWEWPYKLPENWCWTRLGNVSTIVGGGTLLQVLLNTTKMAQFLGSAPLTFLDTVICIFPMAQKT